MNSFDGNSCTEVEDFDDAGYSKYFENIPGLIDNPRSKKLH